MKQACTVYNFVREARRNEAKNEASDSPAIHLYVVTCLYNYGQQTNFTYYGTFTSHMHTKMAKKAKSSRRNKWLVGTKKKKKKKKKKKGICYPLVSEMALGDGFFM